MRFFLVAALLGPALLAQTNPITTDAREGWDYSKGLLLRAAEKTPEEHYAFKPTLEVRSFGEVIAHLVQNHNSLCAAIRGEEPPKPKLDKASKAELVSALKQSVAYCDATFADLTDAKAGELVTVYGRSRARITGLAMLVFHDREHYGNLVTYMRLKGLVPPSSEPRK
jgi:uncharacterized damage-inducible protein DinB